MKKKILINKNWKTRIKIWIETNILGLPMKKQHSRVMTRKYVNKGE